MKQQQIEALLERYLDGETTCQEEQLLRQYFQQTQLVPQEWRAYKALFSWETAQVEQTAAATPTIQPTKRHRTRLLALAAGLAALTAVGIGLWPQQGEAEPRPQNFAVIDGQIVTDQKVIAEEAELALMMVSASDEETFEAINMLAL